MVFIVGSDSFFSVRGIFALGCFGDRIDDEDLLRLFGGIFEFQICIFL